MIYKYNIIVWGEVVELFSWGTGYRPTTPNPQGEGYGRPVASTKGNIVSLLAQNNHVVLVFVLLHLMHMR